MNTKLDALVWEGRNLEEVEGEERNVFCENKSKNKLLKLMFKVSIKTKR